MKEEKEFVEMTFKIPKAFVTFFNALQQLERSEQTLEEWFKEWFMNRLMSYTEQLIDETFNCTFWNADVIKARYGLETFLDKTES